MPTVKLKCAILAKIPNSEIDKFWNCVFRQLKKYNHRNSMSLIFGYPEVRMVFGTDGIFDLEKAEYVEVRFKENLVDWFAKQLKDIEEDELRTTIAGLKSDVMMWYEDWIPQTFKQRHVAKLRREILGPKLLGLWRSPLEARFGAKEQIWLEGDVELRKKRTQRFRPNIRK